MPAEKKLKVVLCWHMHQPEYRDLRTGEYQLPWTYLHAIKDYIDMVVHLEEVPGAKAVVNFAPILLEQIEDYARQTHGYLHDGIAIRDPLLAALVEPAIPPMPEQRLVLIKDCLRANRERQINRYPAFRKLVEMAEWIGDHADAMGYINSQYITDLLVWYHLAWMGETVKRTDLRVKRLIDKCAGYTLHERRELLEVIDEILSTVIGRYRALAGKGAVELSVTPYAHPIMPLLLDVNATRDAMPDARLPHLDTYPGGADRVRWHLREGIETFRRFFGFQPTGCWPSEGGVSFETLQLMEEHGFKWTATGGNVLCNSLHRAGMAEGISPHQAFKVNGNDITCFFRDDGLSDLIGFEYSTWHADDAVADFINHLENIADHTNDNSVVTIIMDGENAWEHYPENAYYFLNSLYHRLASHPRLELSTFAECVDENKSQTQLPGLVAGSWVYGTFSTWIGDVDKNRGWDMLGDVKWCFDKITTLGRISDEQLKKAEHQLAICEGSDWFWWFGDYNPEEAVSSFECQFRLNLANLYQLLGEEPPSYLAEVFTHGSGSPLMGGAMRPGTVKHARN
ncbi:MAG: glycoside hydrolase family 57 protein [Pseudomonadota bacterium]